MLTPEDIAARRGKVTSSIAAAALGKDDNMSPIDAWLSIRGERDFEGNADTYRGNLLEHATLGHGATVCGAAKWTQPKFISHPHMAWAGDSCDALYHDEWHDIIACGEAKTVNLAAADAYGTEGTDEVPPKTAIQACWHLVHYPDAPRCIVPVLVGGYEFVFKHYVIERNEEYLGLLVQDLEKWHRDYVATGVMPPVTAADSEFLTKLHPRATGQMLEPTPELDELVLHALDMGAFFVEAEKARELARNRLREALGPHCGVKGATYSVSYRNNKDSLSVDWRGIAQELGADEKLITKHTRLKEGPRVLRVTPKKVKEQDDRHSAQE